jgi:hypothetical protein
VSFFAQSRSREQTKRRIDCVQRWIGFFEDDGKGFAEGPNYQLAKPHVQPLAKENAIDLARERRAFTVRRDALAR